MTSTRRQALARPPVAFRLYLLERHGQEAIAVRLGRDPLDPLRFERVQLALALLDQHKPDSARALRYYLVPSPLRRRTEAGEAPDHYLSVEGLRGRREYAVRLVWYLLGEVW